VFHIHVILLAILVDLTIGNIADNNDTLFDSSFQFDNTENNESNESNANNNKSSLAFPFDLFDQKTKNNMPFDDFNVSSDTMQNDDTSNSITASETTKLLQNDKSSKCIVNLIEKLNQYEFTDSQQSSSASSQSKNVKCEENPNDKSLSSTQSVVSSNIDKNIYSNAIYNTSDNNSTKDSNDKVYYDSLQKLALEDGESYCDIGSC